MQVVVQESLGLMYNTRLSVKVDDWIVLRRSIANFFEALIDFFARLCAVGVNLSLRKSILCAKADAIPWNGFAIGESMGRDNTELQQVVQTWNATPKTARDLQERLFCLRYFNVMLPNFCMVLQPISELYHRSVALANNDASAIAVRRNGLDCVGGWQLKHQNA